MEKQKNAAILIYPEFSNYEISIVSAIFKSFEKEIVVFCDEGWFSGIRKPVKPEDYTFFGNVQ